MTSATPNQTNPPPMHRRLIAMFYDFAIAGTLAAIVAGIMAYLLEKKGMTIEPNSGLTYSIFALELFVGFLYYQWFCMHRGQTLGMSVWKIRMTNLAGGAITYTQMIIRYIALLIIMLTGFLIGYKLLALSSVSSVGMGLIALAVALAWTGFNNNKQALHEAISGTQLIDLR